jgi:Regulator of chromosome condensation (RCC1) repeat
MKALILYDRACGISINSRRRRCWQLIGLKGDNEIKKEKQRFVRFFASVYTVGHGWTGALGTGRLDQEISGHFDEEEDLHENAQSGTLPIKIYDGTIKSCSVGWAHTGIVVEPGYEYDDNYATMTNHNQYAGTVSSVAQYNNEHDLTLRAKRQNHVLVTGRAQDFQNLFRLQRLPKFARDYAVKQALQTARAQTDIDLPLFDFTRVISYFTDLMNVTSKDDWDAARRLSSLANFTRVDEMYIECKFYDDDPTKDMATTPLLSSGTEDDAADDKDEPIEVFCSAGVTTILMKSGCLYSMGVNIYGQCGVGYTSNNVWFPERVPGLSTEPAPPLRTMLQQSYPITSVALGLQRKCFFAVMFTAFCDLMLCCNRF